MDSRARQALDALTHGQDALESLRAQGTCIAASPELVGRRKFNVTLLYRAPGDLAVRGFDSTGITGQLLRLAVVDGKLDVEIPETSLDPEDMLGRAPADTIAREFFRPEDWRGLSDRRIRIAEGAGTPNRITLLVGKRYGFLRRAVLEGPDWELRESELVNRKGEVLVRVEWNAYAEFDGIRAPRVFDATFPQRGISLRFSLDASKMAFNTDVETADFLQP